MTELKDIVSDERRHYDKMTRAYEDYTNEGYKQILERINFKDGEVGLEVGCASGAWSRRIKCDVVYVLDVSLRQLSFIKGGHILRIQGDAMNLMFKDNSFDWIFFSCSLHHIPDINKCIQDVGHVLKENGRLIIYDPNLHHIQRRLINYHKSTLRRFLSKNMTKYEFLHYPEEYIKKLTEKGFNIERLEYVTPSYKRITLQQIIQYIFERTPFFPQEKIKSYFILIARKVPSSTKE